MSTNNSPIERGTTWYGSQSGPTTIAKAKVIVGMPVHFDNTRATVGVQSSSTTATTLSSAWKDTSILVNAQQVEGVIAKNVMGIAALPGMLVRWKAGYEGTAFDAYVSNTDEPEMVAGIVDDFLPAAGCPDDDICFIVQRGPCRAITKYQDMSADIAIGDFLLGITVDSTTDQTTDAGRIESVSFDNTDVTGDDLLDAVMGGIIGRALNTAITTVTNKAIGVHLNIR